MANVQFADMEKDPILKAEFAQKAATIRWNAICICREFPNVEDFQQLESTLLKESAETAKKAADLWTFCVDNYRENDTNKKSFYLLKIAKTWCNVSTLRLMKGKKCHFNCALHASFHQLGIEYKNEMAAATDL